MEFLSKFPSGVHQLWRYVLGVVLVLLWYMAGQVPYFLLLIMYGVPVNDPNKMKDFSFTQYGIDSNLGFVFMLLMFFIAMAGLYLVVTRLHRRPWKDVITAMPQIRWRRMLEGFIAWMILNLLLEYIVYLLFDTPYTLQFHIGSFILLVIISGLMLPVQTGFEELFFRGYLMQGFGILLNQKWMPALVTSILFGMMHLANPEIKEYGVTPMLLFYISAGFFLAYVAIQDSGLEISIGVHTATNFVGAVLVNYEGSVLQTKALLLTGKSDPWVMLVGFWGMALIYLFWASARYNWPSWRSFFLSPQEGSGNENEKSGLTS